MRQVLIFRGDSGLWVGFCPSLPACISQGETKEEAIANMKLAIADLLDALQTNNLPIPEETLDAELIQL